MDINKQPRSKLRGISRRNNLNRQDAKDAKNFLAKTRRPWRPGGSILITASCGELNPPEIKRAQKFLVKTRKRMVHRRKHRKQLYSDHLATVAKLVSSVTDNPATIAPVWPHDLVESPPSLSHYGWEKIVHLSHRSAGRINMILLGR